MRDTLDQIDPQVDGELRTQRYTLLTAVRVVQAMETTQGRSDVFAEIAAKNRIIRWVDQIYRSSGPFRRLLIAAYMLKSAVSLGSGAHKDAPGLAVANFDNELHAIERIKAMLPGTEINVMRNNRRNITKPSQIGVCLKALARMPRVWRFIGKIARTHSFMPACRISSVLAYYMRFGDVLADFPIQAALTASNYSPEAVGLSAAAHKRNLPVIYTNHAPVPLNSAYVPPVLADISIFHGQATQNVYQTRSKCLGHTLWIGQNGMASDMVLKSKADQVGIFLTALTRLETIETLVEAIKADRPEMRILIRHHPVAMLETDLTALREHHPDIEVTLGTPLDDDIASCDLVFCGNSGVIQNTLRGGRPVAYLPELDRLPLDYNGFWESGLVTRVSGWSPQLGQNLDAFYSDPTWAGVMQSYDASYKQSKDQLEAQARAVLLSCLTPTRPSRQLGFSEIGLASTA